MYDFNVSNDWLTVVVTKFKVVSAAVFVSSSADWAASNAVSFVDSWACLSVFSSPSSSASTSDLSDRTSAFASSNLL